MTTPQISAADVEAFQRDGITVIRGVFSEWVETLREGVEQNMREPGPFARFYTEPGKPGHFFGDYCNWARIPAYERFVRDSSVGQAAAILMQSDTARFFHEHVLVKEPGTTEPTPWHHDQPYYSVDGGQNVSFWIPLDNVARDVCPEFVRGSHRWGKWYTPTRFTGKVWDRENENEGLELIPDISANRDNYDLVAWDLAPGDALAFNFLTVHGAPPNLSGSERRRGFSARLVGDDARWATRTGETSPPFPELHKRMKHGDRLDDVEEFPLIHHA